MKNLSSSFFGITVVFLLVQQCYAQVRCYFDPSVVAYIDSVGADSVLTYWTTFYWQTGVPRNGGFYIPFISSPGVTADPPEVLNDEGSGGIAVKVTVDLDSALGSASNCSGEPLMVYGENGSYNIYIYRYNPIISGRVRLSSDTVNFGSVPLGEMWYKDVGVAIDTEGSIFRTLSVRGIHKPFAWASTITPDTFGSCPWFQLPPASFQPAALGKYIDTLFIYDSIQTDSIPLILIGEGVAASVGNSLEEASHIAISPNPCDKHCTLSINDGQIEHVIVRNLLGECVLDIPSLHNDEFSISTASFTDGIYFIEVRSNENVFRERVIVAH